MKLNILFLLTTFLFIAPLQAQGTLGVVLMHGKAGNSSDNSPVGQLVPYLRAEDILVVTPDMPWHGSRYLDKSYEDSMLEIDEAVEELRSKGAEKIVVGGHSMGANAALGYGARREGLSGILAIAPGHVPGDDGFQGKIDYDFERAQKMVDAGRGSEMADFKDRNMGFNTEVSMTAVIYLSWFDPKGPASMWKNASKLKDTPLFWIIGKRDSMHKRGKDYAFNDAPAHPKNQYVVIGGGHKETPRRGYKEILEWLKSL